MKHSTAALLALGVVVLLVANSADFFFHTPYYETWDSAANSLYVNQAKHFAQLYGPYSRWGFNHPGPALFYVQALGEWLFYDALHWTPAPFNAQVLLYLFVSVGFFVAALRVFAGWLPAGRWRWWFLCAALGLATLHFTGANNLPSYDVLRGPSVFSSPWSGHVLVLPFLCLLVAGASVAAGRGTDLPLLALADGFLLHTHVAQPLFVGPVTLLAYTLLLWRSVRLENARGVPQPLADRVLAAWRAWRGAHVAALAILAVFALPYLVDFSRGSHSNLAAIIHHLRTHRGEHKPFGQSWFYFLQFGAYTPCQPLQIELLPYTASDEWAYLRAHTLFYVAWAAVAALAAWALARGGWSGIKGTGEDVLTPPARREARRFLTWAAVFLALGILLTLYWGTIQDGQMFYYNAWFTFAVYYLGLLVAAAVGCGWLPETPAWALSGVTPARRERLAGVAMVLVLATLCSRGLRVSDPDPASTRAMHESVAQALAATADPDGKPVIRSLRFTEDIWIMMAGVALQAERAGQPVCVPDGWALFFGRQHGWSEQPEALLRAGRVRVWRFDHQPNFDAMGTPATHFNTTTINRVNIGLPDDVAINYAAETIDPGKADRSVICLAPGGRSNPFIVGGWSFPEPWGSWNEGPHSVLEFCAAPVTTESPGVDLTLVGLNPFLDPPHGLREQRLRVFFNGEALGSEVRLASGQSPTYRISAERWNRAAAAPGGGRVLLETDFPDAASAASLDPTGQNQDTRLLGAGLKEVRFQAVAARSP